jgi:hypothetical protein
MGRQLIFVGFAEALQGEPFAELPFARNDLT